MIQHTVVTTHNRSSIHPALSQPTIILLYLFPGPQLKKGFLLEKNRKCHCIDEIQRERESSTNQTHENRHGLGSTRLTQTPIWTTLRFHWYRFYVSWRKIAAFWKGGHEKKQFFFVFAGARKRIRIMVKRNCSRWQRMIDFALWAQHGVSKHSLSTYAKLYPLWGYLLKDASQRLLSLECYVKVQLGFKKSTFPMLCWSNIHHIRCASAHVFDSTNKESQRYF